MAMNEAEERMIFKAAQRLMGGVLPSEVNSSEANSRAMRDLLTAIGAEENIDLDEIRERYATQVDYKKTQKGKSFKILPTQSMDILRDTEAAKLQEIRKMFPPGPERDLSKAALHDAMYEGILDRRTGVGNKFKKRTRKEIRKSTGQPKYERSDQIRTGLVDSFANRGKGTPMQRLVDMRRAKGMLPLLLLSLLGAGGAGLMGMAAGGRREEV